MLPAAFVFLKLASRRSVGSMREGEFIPIRTQEASNLLKFQIGERSAEDVRKLSYSDVVDLWQSNPRFVELFTQVGVWVRLSLLKTKVYFDFEKQVGWKPSDEILCT